MKQAAAETQTEKNTEAQNETENEEVLVIDAADPLPKSELSVGIDEAKAAMDPEPVAQTEAMISGSPRLEIPQYNTTEHNVVDFTKFENMAKTEPEEAIILTEQEYQTEVLQGGYTLEEQSNIKDKSHSQPIDVMAAEDFSKGLKMPQRRSELPKGERTKRVTQI